MQHVPNTLTISRILITPIILYLVTSQSQLGRFTAFTLFVVAAISDYLDGKLARHYEVKSRLGQFLDPFADKVLVLGTFAVLAYAAPSLVPWWAVVLIALRDVVVTGVRTRFESQGKSVTTMKSAKMKTLVQLIFLIVLLLLRAAERIRGIIGEIAEDVLESPIPVIVLIGVVAFTVWTGIVYVFRPQITAPIKQNG